MITPRLLSTYWCICSLPLPSRIELVMISTYIMIPRFPWNLWIYLVFSYFLVFLKFYYLIILSTHYHVRTYFLLAWDLPYLMPRFADPCRLLLHPTTVEMVPSKHSFLRLPSKALPLGAFNFLVKHASWSVWFSL